MINSYLFVLETWFPSGLEKTWTNWKIFSSQGKVREFD